MTTKLSPPTNSNTQGIIALVDGIVYDGKVPRTRVAAKRYGFFEDLALGVYVVLLGAIIWGITSLLLLLQFHVIDIVLFVLFLALICYFAFRIRHSARSMQLRGAKEGFFTSLLEFLALPIVSVGRYLVTKFERLNVVAMFMDFFIELPFTLVLEFFDTFSRVLREKRDEIYS
jgi:hypothetical protein